MGRPQSIQGDEIFCLTCKRTLPRDQFKQQRKRPDGSVCLITRCEDCERVRSFAKNKRISHLKAPGIVKNLDGEVWVPFIGHENRFMVSNYARIKTIDFWLDRGLKGKYFFPSRLRKVTKDSHGYFQISVQRGITVPLHHAVFFSFNPLIEKIDGFEVDHIDNDKTNCLPGNLQYITKRENVQKRFAYRRKAA